MMMVRCDAMLMTQEEAQSESMMLMLVCYTGYNTSNTNLNTNAHMQRNPLMAQVICTATKQRCKHCKAA